jgi:hypothetical protein
MIDHNDRVTNIFGLKVDGLGIAKAVPMCKSMELGKDKTRVVNINKGIGKEVDMVLDG